MNRLLLRMRAEEAGSSFLVISVDKRFPLRRTNNIMITMLMNKQDNLFKDYNMNQKRNLRLRFLTRFLTRFLIKVRSPSKRDKLARIVIPCTRRGHLNRRRSLRLRKLPQNLAMGYRSRRISL